MGTNSDRPGDRAPVAIIIMGVSGSGKSTLGAELSSALGCPYVEGDAFHSPDAVAKMRAGAPLTDEDRWPWLDRIAAMINTALADNGAVVAACSALRRAYRDRLRKRIVVPPHFVLLDGRREELSRRLANRPGHYMPASLLSSQLETLERPEPDEKVLILGAEAAPGFLRDQVVAWIRSGH